MPAPCRKTATGRSVRTGCPPVAAKTLRPSTSKIMEPRRSFLRGLQRLGKIVDDVAGILEADREADQLLADAGGFERRFIELAMRGAGRMDDQGLRVTDIGEMRGKLQRVDELAARGAS